ncbi:hypothetical protein JCM33374_g3638 [Metschnikowia sp. JCM 33374]|nr:hypothetical protein JCM33374_g3638 [Metschnikowia sp. JCM 33374]
MPVFKQVDVFSKEKYRGNPVAVFLDADNLSTEEMSRMSAWTNLSEATFVQRATDSKADYKVRIFSLETELPFAGHPTIGTCHALLESGVIQPTDGKIYQECGAGIVELEIHQEKISFELPYARRRELTPAQIQTVVTSLGVPFSTNRAAIYEVGPVWLVVRLDSASTVLSLEPDFVAVSQVSEALGVAGFQVLGSHPEENCFETRTFAPLLGIKEDPVCGSGSGATGAFLRDEERFNGTCLLRQGTALNRKGRVKVSVGEKISVGGASVTVLRGEY